MSDSFGARSTLTVGDSSVEYFRLDAVEGSDRLPFALKVLLENLLRHEGELHVSADDVRALASWDPQAEPSVEIAFTPARVLLQDFTGVPCIVDLAAMREAMTELGGDPHKINPLAPAELVIDHSVIADVFGRPDAFEINAELEFERNAERYQFLRWGQSAFSDFVVVPPDTGIVHQVNLERLARVVVTRDGVAYPDTLVGTDSHTTMINGLGVLGWGVGGMEAGAAMLGQPVSMLIPKVVGIKLIGELPVGTTATDLVLTVTEMLRGHGVVGKIVEFYGEGLANVPLANRATIGNMSPEYGSTAAMFPLDEETLAYLRLSGRAESQVALVEAYAKANGLWHDPSREPTFSETRTLDLATVVPSLAGPKRPQDRVPLSLAKPMFRSALAAYVTTQPPRTEGQLDEAAEESFPASDPIAAGTIDREADRPLVCSIGDVSQRPSNPVVTTLADGSQVTLDHGAVVIAAITSCTNTSNPQVMIGAALLAKKAVELGLTSKPWVKTTLAPGSKVVMGYYQKAGLMPYLEKLGFDLVGYGCTTCIGNSGPLPAEVSKAVHDGDLAVTSVLSGNRNFEGRINPDVKMNYLASPPLCVAYALAGTIDIDLYDEPLGEDEDGRPVFLKDLWPSAAEVAATVEEAVQSDMFRKSYGEVFDGDERWSSLAVPTGERFQWAEDSTYVRRPPFFEHLLREPEPIADVQGARVLAVLGDSVTTDHISPAGSIKRDGPAGRYLIEHGVQPKDFNSYGSRRGNHEVMMRGTFANIRLRNELATNGQRGPDGALRDRLPEGGVTLHLPDKIQMSIYDAAMRYLEEGTPLVVLAGRDYGSGSSRDWAAKGARLLGVRAVIAQSFERIHRSNLVGMGVLPLQFEAGESVRSLGLTGHESFAVTGLADAEIPRQTTVTADDKRFTVTVRIDTPQEQRYFAHGGILQFVLRELLAS
ncbi:MAG: aconitate hydratase [Solirubrobacteraceae bacterium]